MTRLLSIVSVLSLSLATVSTAFAQDEQADSDQPVQEPWPAEEDRAAEPAVEPAYVGQRQEDPAVAQSIQTAPAAAPTKKFLHGFRLGYVHFRNYNMPIDGDANGDGVMNELDGETWKDKYGIKSPNMFLLGYELTRRIKSGDWLNVILVGNASVTGLEQSLFLVTASGIVGFEFNEQFQVGVGVNLAPTRDKPAHMVMAAGFMPKVGSMSVPIHVVYIPDVDDADRFGVTVGVNW